MDDVKENVIKLTEEGSKTCIKALNSVVDLREFFLFNPFAISSEFSKSEFFHSNSLLQDIDNRVLSQDGVVSDIFNVNLNQHKNDKKVLSIYNPPFSDGLDYAVNIFNELSKQSEHVAFVAPKSFRKSTVQNRLNLKFTLVSEIELPKKSFTKNGKSFSPNCVFQVWSKNKNKRKVIVQNKLSDMFHFTSKSEADFAIRRVGGVAGRVLLQFGAYSKESNYFIKVKNKKNLNQVISIFEKLYKELKNIASDCASVPSINKSELISAFNNYVAEEKPYSKNQSHGIEFESQVLSGLGGHLKLLSQSKIATWDVSPTSVKSFKFNPRSKSNTIYFGSIKNIFKINSEFNIALIGYKQDKNIKKVILSDFVSVSETQLKRLRGGLTLSEIEQLSEKLKSFPVGEHEAAREWYKSILHEYKDKTMFTINFKVDSKNQRRIQCSLSIENLYKVLGIELLSLSNKLNIKDIHSGQRLRA